MIQKSLIYRRALQSCSPVVYLEELPNDVNVTLTNRALRGMGDCQSNVKKWECAKLLKKSQKKPSKLPICPLYNRAKPNPCRKMCNRARFQYPPSPRMSAACTVALIRSRSCTVQRWPTCIACSIHRLFYTQRSLHSGYVRSHRWWLTRSAWEIGVPKRNIFCLRHIQRCSVHK